MSCSARTNIMNITSKCKPCYTLRAHASVDDLDLKQRTPGWVHTHRLTVAADWQDRLLSAHHQDENPRRSPLGMYGAQVRVLKQVNKECLDSLVQGKQSLWCETQPILDIQPNLTHQARKGKLLNQQLARSLILSDLFQSTFSWSVPDEPPSPAS